MTLDEFLAEAAKHPHSVVMTFLPNGDLKINMNGMTDLELAYAASMLQTLYGNSLNMKMAQCFGGTQVTNKGAH